MSGSMEMQMAKKLYYAFSDLYRPHPLARAAQRTISLAPGGASCNFHAAAVAAWPALRAASLLCIPIPLHRAV